MDPAPTRPDPLPPPAGVPPVDWLRMKNLIADALELAAEARSDFVRRSCADSPSLAAPALAMLAAATAAPDFLTNPVLPEFPPNVAHMPPGTTLGPYTVERLLGEGGFSEVYAARQLAPIERRVALKLLKPGMDSRAVLARFALERRTLARLDHPSIARILDAGATAEGRPFVVMELVAGCTLAQFAREAKPDRRRRLDLFLQACDAVAHAHQHGVIHRDLKPSNLMVAEGPGGPRLKVIDFGIAKVLGEAGEQHTHTGQMLGTPGYWSPEQHDPDGAGVDVRTDVFALGVVFRELNEAPHELKPPREFRWIVARACANDREQRYSSVAEFAADVSAYLRGDALRAGPPTRRYRLAKFVRRNRGLLAALGAIACALVAGAVVSAVGFYRADQARAMAETAQLEADTTADYLTRLIAEVKPGRAGRDIKVRDLLDASGALLKSAERAPEAAARLHLVIGSAYQALGELEPAKRHLRTAADSYAKRHGELDWRAIDAACLLAGAMSSSGDLDALEQLLPEVSARAIAARGPNHPKARVLIDLRAKIAFDRGRPADAEQPLRELLELETNHGSVDGRISVLGNLAQVLLGRRAIAEARRFATEGRDLALARHGPEHPITMAANRKLAAVEVANGDPAAVADLLAPVLPIAWRALGTDHPEALGIANYLAYAYQQQRRFAEAEAVYRDLIPAQGRKFSRQHPQPAMTALNYGRMLHAQGRHGTAEPVLQDAHARFLALRGPDDANTIQAECLLCSSIAKQGGDDEVLTRFAIATLALSRALAPTSETVQSARRDWNQHFARLLLRGMASNDFTKAGVAWYMANRRT